MENNYYNDVTSFMKIGKIDPNVNGIMKELEDMLDWREWSIATVWRCGDNPFKCDALIRMLEERKKNILLDEMIKREEEKARTKEEPEIEEEIEEMTIHEQTEEDKNILDEISKRLNSLQ